MIAITKTVTPPHTTISHAWNMMLQAWANHTRYSVQDIMKAYETNIVVMPDNSMKIITHDTWLNPPKELTEGKSVYKLDTTENLAEDYMYEEVVYKKDGVMMIKEDDEDEDTLENYMSCWMFITDMDHHIDMYEKIREIQHRNYLK